MINKGTWIKIQSYKHDGSLHRCWDHGLVIDINEDFVVVGSRKTKVTESDGRRWYTREPAITVFSLKEWYNAICMIKEDGISFYCNIASPSIIHNDMIKYIDYDLDLKLFQDGNIKILDENEYQRHKIKYQYSDDLDKVLNKEVSIIHKQMENRIYPFNNESIQKYYDEFLKMLDEQYNSEN